jgi:hypothetical protein
LPYGIYAAFPLHLKYRGEICPQDSILCKTAHMGCLYMESVTLAGTLTELYISEAKNEKVNF